VARDSWSFSGARRLDGAARQAPSARSFLPRFIEQTSTGTRDYDPFSKLFEERIVFIGTVIDDVTANDVIVQLLCLESMEPDRDVSIYINSPGGSIDSLMAIYDTMQFIRPQIQTVCMGQANSAAAVLLSAGSKGKRFALPNARVLIHQPSSGGTQGQVSDLQIHAEEISRMRDQLEEILAKHTGQSIAQVREDIERDKIFDAESAVEYGLIDGVVQSRALVATP
jgi:ATP-dependent Clp protease, protease subunit